MSSTTSCSALSTEDLTGCPALAGVLLPAHRSQLLGPISQPDPPGHQGPHSLAAVGQPPARWRLCCLLGRRGQGVLGLPLAAPWLGSRTLAAASTVLPVPAPDVPHKGVCLVQTAHRSVTTLSFS